MRTVNCGWSRYLAAGQACSLARRSAGFAQALAQTPEQFYRGKTVEIVIGYSVGGGYDIYARMIARHLGKHIPGNPTVVAKNMEGAGGMRLANWLYGAAARDGTVIGATSRAMAFEPILGNKAAQYDASRITYIGSANDEVSVCMAWHTAGIATFADAAGARAGRGRQRHRRRHLSIPGDPQQHVRRQVQDGHRLSRRYRDQYRDGAHRGARTLRLPVVDREGDLPALDQGEEVQSADAVLARQACPSCRTFRW